MTGLSSDTTFTCSYGGASDTCTVTVPSAKTATTLTSSQISDNDFVPSVGWQVLLKDANNTALSGKTVKFYIDNTFISSNTTQSNGTTGFTSQTNWGTHTIKAVFEGDDSYEGSEVSRTVTFDDPFGGLDL